MTVLTDSVGGILGYGRDRRYATPAQRWALAARNGCCSFPACTMPVQWREANRIRAWLDGGQTNIDNVGIRKKPSRRPVL